VLAQFALIGVIAICWVVPPAFPDGVLDIVGGALAGLGLALAVWATRALGKSLTPYPTPRARGVLVTSGPFAHARHPVYGGGFLFFVGTSLIFSVPALVVTGLLGVLWWLKSHEEERRLVDRFPEYEEYRRRVRPQFIPYLF
jgi:protein-S-isoprenylcysteine O-methyltransferase Ste14